MLGVLAAVVGILVIGALLKNRGPAPPRCRAVLKSGERCEYDAEHEGYHRTTIYNSGHMRQNGYCWEDPSAGVHRAGFF